MQHEAMKKALQEKQDKSLKLHIIIGGHGDISHKPDDNDMMELEKKGTDLAPDVKDTKDVDKMEDMKLGNLVGEESTEPIDEMAEGPNKEMAMLHGMFGKGVEEAQPNIGRHSISLHEKAGEKAKKRYEELKNKNK